MVTDQTDTEKRLFLIEKILKNPRKVFDPQDEEMLSCYRREQTDHPMVYIGTGTCGIIAGAMATLDAINQFIDQHHWNAEVVEVGCCGLCASEPLVDIQLPGKTRVSFQHITAEKVESLLLGVLNKTLYSDYLLGQYRTKNQEPWVNVPFLEELLFFKSQTRIILPNIGLISPFSIDDYISMGGYRALWKTVLNYTNEKVCDLIELSELRGRGGGGFPTGKKWRIALSTSGDQKYLICNADESDPGTYIDRVILEGDPHRLIEGIAIASYAIGANNAFIFLRSDFQRPIVILEQAIRQAKESGILGENIFGSGFSLSIHIRQSAGAFVCGEETALIKSLEGYRGMPISKPPYPAEKGLFGCPTVVNNIETLINIPGIIAHGPAWFKSIGTELSKGTKIVSVAGKNVQTSFVEVPMGVRLAEIIHMVGGIQNGHSLKAVQLGGPTGICIPSGQLDMNLDYESLKDAGAMMGTGGLILLDESVCMVSLSKYFMKFLQKESCGKCIPCREGTKRMLEILEGITKRPKEESSHETLERFKGVVQLETLAEVIRDTSLCGLGQHASNPVQSTLKWFREEFEEHIFDRQCRAGVCTDLRTYVIEVERCTGCNLCQKKCPVNAIIGTVRNPHFIIESKCTGCGICFDVCKFNAIYFK